MSNQIDKTKGPGVYIPPPLFYVVIFLAAELLQRLVPLNKIVFQGSAIKYAGIFLFIIAFIFMFSSLRKFFLSRNTVILIKPASSLQTTGIYGITRNPMYIGLTCLYLCITCFRGSWWNIILFPALIIIIQEYVIKSEERYLVLEFGQQYEDYRRKVRRWI
jgi:protein-S-isoprenylcysteine O-methyltransferase Ste14